MSLADEHDDGMVEAILDSNVTFTLNGAEYSCIASEGSAQKPVIEGGFMDDVSITFSTRPSYFTTAPAVGNKITFANQQYRIVKIGTNQTGKILNLYCDAVNK